MKASPAKPAPTGLPVLQLWLFASPNFPTAALSIAIAVYVPQHFARNLGMDLAAVGFAFALVRLIDIPIDPFLGVAMDRTKSAWGRYRLWLIAGTPITMLAVYMLFMAPHGITTSYVVVWYLILYLGTSIIGLSHSAWAASLAPNYNERSRVFGVFGAASVAGMTLVLVVPLMASALSSDARNATVPQMGWFVLATLPLATIAAAALTGENIAPQRPSARASARDYFAVVLNPSMARIALAGFFFTLGTGWEGGLYMFYYNDVRHFSEGEASLLLMSALAAGILGGPAISWVANRTSKHGALVGASIAYGASLGSLWFIPISAPNWVLYLPVVTSGFLYTGFLVLLRSMTADVADQIRLEQGKERSGLLYSLITLGPKLSAALAIWLTFSLLATFDYAPSLGSANTPTSIESLAVMYVIGPNVCVGVGALCILGYGLDRRKVAAIRQRLEQCDRQQQLSTLA